MRRERHLQRRLAVGILMLAAVLAGEARGQAELVNTTGRLSNNSDKLRSGEFCASHNWNVTAGQVYAVRMYSDELAPYIIIQLGDEQQLECSGVGGSAQAIFVAPRSGRIDMLATTVEVGERGAYRLTVTGGELTGRLSENDAALDSGEYIDEVPVYLPANTTLPVSLESEDFDPYVIAMGSEQTDGSGQRGAGNGATTQIASGEAGVYKIGVTSAAAGERGVYRLRVGAGGGGGERPTQPTRPPGGGLGSVLGGAGAQAAQLLNETGSLDKGDEQLRSGEFRDEYFFEVKAQQTVTVKCESSDFDTYLICQVPGVEEQVENDDAARGSTNAQVRFTSPQDGRVRVLVTSARVGETGQYRLTASASGGLPRGSTPGNGALPANAAAPGRPVTGRLQQGDQTLDSGEFVDVHEFALQSGRNYQITLTSTEFDAYLIVLPPGGAQKLENDDTDGVPNGGSRVEFTAAADGNCTVGVTTYEPGMAGAYQLQVSEAQGGGGGGGPELTGGQAIGANSFFEGDLAQGDRQMDSGEWYDVHELPVQPGQNYVVELHSDQFDAYLIAIPPQGDQLDNDDAGGTTDSQVEFRPRQAGTYRLVVTSARAGEVGRYTLSVRGGQGAVDGPRVDNAPTGPAQQVQGNADVQQIAGELGGDDSRLNSGEFADTYRLQLRAGDLLQVQMSSDALDPYLFVVPPDGAGEQIDNDDMGEGSTAAGIQLQCTRDGEYRVVATTYKPGETGAYQLAIRVGAGGAAPVDPGGTRPGPGQQGNFPSPFPTGPQVGGATGQPTPAPDGRKTFGVFVGIDAYPDSPLQFCAGDATKMAQMFEELGIVPANQRRVLTDAQATKANILRALQEIGRMAGPQDMLMFFFSGHGGQTPERPNSNEADQVDEFIFAVDEPILDDEMARLLDTLNVGLTLVYLDSCFSGGFAKDIITKPGRMGVFSSDEDLTSNVAGKFQAGGYLSMLMLKGVRGAADENTDKVITSGELSFYLEEAFNREAGTIGAVTSGEERGYQRLRIDRGGVKLSTPLFYLPR